LRIGGERSHRSAIVRKVRSIRLTVSAPTPVNAQELSFRSRLGRAAVIGGLKRVEREAAWTLLAGSRTFTGFSILRKALKFVLRSGRKRETRKATCRGERRDLRSLSAGTSASAFTSWDGSAMARKQTTTTDETGPLEDVAKGMVRGAASY
jgi:hypothetical protein